MSSSSYWKSSICHHDSWTPTFIGVGLGCLIGFKLHKFLPPKAWLTWRYKLVIVVPTLNGIQRLTNSQTASLCSSASILAFETSRKYTPCGHFVWQWLGQPKMVLKTKSLKDLEHLARQASRLQVCSSVVKDAQNKISVLAIGPGPNSIIDQITGHLKLL